MKRYFIKTFGCQMNVADSEEMAGVLQARGYLPAPRPEEADVIVVNTCTIRRKAEEKGYSELGRYCGLKRRRGGVVVVAAGCAAGKDGRRLLSRLPQVDLVVGPSRVRRLGELLDGHTPGGELHLDLDPAHYPGAGEVPVRAGRVTAYVSIVRGCDNFCSYCVVPHVRGREVSRPPGEVEEEVRRLAGEGYGEITLLGQNVNSYGRGLDPPVTFPQLLERLDRNTGIRRLRFTTSHPRDFGPDLAAAVADLPSVCEWVHLPLQSGSDRVLAAMNRGYTRTYYLDLVEDLRRRVPGIAVSTDLIVGHPGEEEEDFRQTVETMRRLHFSGVFAFKFSPREGTAAAALPDSVPAGEKERRLAEVLALQREITLEQHRRMVGGLVEVLVEGPGKAGEGELTGRTRGNTVVHFRGDPTLTGRTVSLRVTRACAHSLGAEIPSG
jgi:tRNA-2-methylthio-N6-dimethylallyladenosine synthase